MKKYLLLLLILIPNVVGAKEITSSCTITSDEEEYQEIVDDDFTTKVYFDQDETINIKCDSDISYIYISYDKTYVPGLIKGNKTYSLGDNKYLHELVKLEEEKDITLSFTNSFVITDIYLFDEELPDWVQNWQTLDKADLMLFSTHSDDEQLFFAGLLPTYADRGKKIEVVYYTNHYNNISRYHELLNGLWTLGIKYYPEMSTFPDEYSETLEDALANLENAGFTEEDAIKFQVDMIRKYQPRVVVGHDEKGEYSHGQHILNTYTLEKAIYKAADENYKTDNDYPAYQIDKLYLHLYEENPIVMNYDTPLSSFNGKTAYEVAKEGYAKHLSQQYTWFTAWLNGDNNEFTKMTDIEEYSPCNFGLYYTNVGEDSSKDDMFENIKERKTEDNKKEDISNNEPKEKEKKSNINYKIILGIFLMLSSGAGLLYILINTKKTAK